ncbi:transcription antitermination factor NusB [Candidatus Daviesbacteria bacterium]|nr:transcription antitermination factor NusB [Candidatus Daviesbacteria bacterium]
MKTSRDPRHIERIRVMKELFAWEFNDYEDIENDKTKAVIKNLKEIDQSINISAPAWPIEKINKVDLAILRIAVFELLIEKKTPPKVITDEAVEIAKEYGSESSPSFVNGALGKLISDNNIPV